MVKIQCSSVLRLINISIVKTTAKHHNRAGPCILKFSLFKAMRAAALFKQRNNKTANIKQ